MDEIINKLHEKHNIYENQRAKIKEEKTKTIIEPLYILLCNENNSNEEKKLKRLIRKNEKKINGRFYAKLKKSQNKMNQQFDQMKIENTINNIKSIEDNICLSNFNEFTKIVINSKCPPEDIFYFLGTFNGECNDLNINYLQNLISNSSMEEFDRKLAYIKILQKCIPTFHFDQFSFFSFDSYEQMNYLYETESWKYYYFTIQHVILILGVMLGYKNAHEMYSFLDKSIKSILSFLKDYLNFAKCSDELKELIKSLLDSDNFKIMNMPDDDVFLDKYITENKQNNMIKNINLLYNMFKNKTPRPDKELDIALENNTFNEYIENDTFKSSICDEFEASKYSIKWKSDEFILEECIDDNGIKTFLHKRQVIYYRENYFKQMYYIMSKNIDNEDFNRNLTFLASKLDDKSDDDFIMDYCNTLYSININSGDLSNSVDYLRDFLNKSYFNFNNKNLNYSMYHYHNYDKIIMSYCLLKFSILDNKYDIFKRFKTKFEKLENFIKEYLLLYTESSDIYKFLTMVINLNNFSDYCEIY